MAKRKTAVPSKRKRAAAKAGEPVPQGTGRAAPVAQRSLGNAVLRWHHSLAQITGSLSMRMAKHTLVKREVQEWADTCKAVAAEMTDFVNGETHED